MASRQALSEHAEVRKGRANRTMKQKEHARIRAKERLGFMPTHREMKALSARVRAGQFVRNGVGGRQVWRVPFRQTYQLVVFDPKRGHIVSFLTDPKSSQTTERPSLRSDRVDVTPNAPPAAGHAEDSSSALSTLRTSLRALRDNWRVKADGIEGMGLYFTDCRVAANILDCADDLDALIGDTP